MAHDEDPPRWEDHQCGEPGSTPGWVTYRPDQMDWPPTLGARCRLAVKPIHERARVSENMMLAAEGSTTGGPKPYQPW